MKTLTDEILTRFPEVRDSVFDGDEELPYVMMDHLADWVASEARATLDPKTVNRVIDFCNWCKYQARGSTAADDILTIWTVSFYETMFEKREMHLLIPMVVSKQEIVDNKEYLLRWVGQDAYEEVLKSFE